MNNQSNAIIEFIYYILLGSLISLITILLSNIVFLKTLDIRLISFRNLLILTIFVSAVLVVKNRKERMKF